MILMSIFFIFLFIKLYIFLNTISLDMNEKLLNREYTLEKCIEY